MRIKNLIKRHLISREIVLIRIYVDNTVRACLDAVSGTGAFFIIYQDKAVRPFINGAVRTGIYAGRIITVHTGVPDIS